MNQKHISISSYSDLLKLSPRIKSVHFRKFVSRNILKKVLSVCLNLERISFSRYAFSRCDSNFIEELLEMGVSIGVSRRNAGRPNLIEKSLQEVSIKNHKCDISKDI